MGDDVTILIPAYNEGQRLKPVLEAVLDAGYRALVVDDGSTDETAAIGRAAGATVLSQPTNRGYVAALRRGFRAVETEITVTLDADGEHRVADVPSLLEPIRDDRADLVFGARQSIARPSERLLNWIATHQVPVSDTGTGFRALRTALARDLELDTACTCGTVALEAMLANARMTEVPIETATVEKPRGVAFEHAEQLGHVLRYALRVARDS